MKTLSRQLLRLSQIPRRVRSDLRIISLLKNWPAALSAELTGAPLRSLRMRNGVVIEAPATLDLAFLFHEIWVRRTYTFPGFEIQPGETVVDVGGNIGVFAAYAAKAARDVKVYSYEPFPGNVIWLRKNIAESKLTNVRVNMKAVAGESGHRTLHVNPERWIVHSLVREEGDQKQDITVECVTLAQVFDSNEIVNCDLLKLDCEGSEYEILMNSDANTLKRVRRIVGEYHEGPHIGKTGDDLRGFLESHSFRIDYFGQRETDSGIFYATNVAR